MIYKIDYNDAVLEFLENKGRIFLEAADSKDALDRAREFFSQTRDEEVKALGMNQYLVTFKVDFQYRRGLLREIKKTHRYISCYALYQNARFLDRYILAQIRKETGKPKWLKLENYQEEIRALRRAAVVAREVSNIIDFVDWDICLFNYIELNSKEGHKSRIIRKVRKR